jgi:cytoskeletal protein RodZ
VSIGDALAAARREAGLTITQVSQRTCIRETIVRGIERGDYSACGGDFYARGHIRSIARAVGLDPDQLVHEYDATQASQQPITAAEVFQPFTPVRLRERRRANWSVVLLVGLVAVLGIAGYKFVGSHSPAKPAASTSLDHPHKVKSTTVPAAHHAAPDHVRLTLIATPGAVTWYQFTYASGQPVQGYVGGTYPARVTKTQKDSITLQLGNPGGATLYLNGKKQTLIKTQPETLLCNKTKCTQTG